MPGIVMWVSFLLNFWDFLGVVERIVIELRHSWGAIVEWGRGGGGGGGGGGGMRFNGVVDDLNWILHFPPLSVSLQDLIYKYV